MENRNVAVLAVPSLPWLNLASDPVQVNMIIFSEQV